MISDWIEQVLRLTVTIVLDVKNAKIERNLDKKEESLHVESLIRVSNYLERS